MDPKNGGEDGALRITLQPPALILVIGVAGSGKTTIARGLVSAVHAAYFDKDVLTDAFFPASRGRAYEELRPRLYAALYALVEENLRLGTSVVLDAPHVKEMADPAWRREMVDLAVRAGAGLTVVRCHCREPILRRRLEERAEPRDRWKLENWDRFVTEQPPRGPIPLDHLDVDTERPPEQNVRAVLDALIARSARSPR